jgi:hypothetical protein
MGRLRFRPLAAVIAISLFLLLPACAKKGPVPASPVPVRITLNPNTSFSMQAGTVVQITANAQNSANATVTPTFSFFSSDPTVVDVAPNGAACAGKWNAPLYTVCAAGGTGEVQVTASALGATSPPTLFFVHPPIDNIQISVVPPVNSPPPACPNQTALPAACELKFNATNACLSQNQVDTLQATAYSQGVDITASVGPFTWTAASASVVKITPIVTINSYNVPTNQATVSPSTPGQTQIIASASGAFSQPYLFETCPVQCIDLQLSVNGQLGTSTSFVVNKGTAETITATAVDVQGCIVSKPPLTWVSSSPASLLAGSATTGCAAGATCTVTSPLPGAAAITASCSPPTCNIGFPLNPAGFPAGSEFIPGPVYPITPISGIVTGAPASTDVIATSQDCYSDAFCGVGLYYVSTSTSLPGGAVGLPTPPNSLMWDPPGDRAYIGSEFGATSFNPASIGTATNPFTPLPAAGTTLGLVTGKVLAVSPTGSSAIFSDTVSTPNQVYIVGSTTSSAGSTPLSIDSAIAAAFSPDGLKAFILGNGGTTLYIYSTLQAPQSISLPTPATSIVFNSSGSFALLSGGGAPGNLAVYNTCDNSPVSLSSGALPGPPLFLKMVPGGNVPLGGTFGSIVMPLLQAEGLDFFFGLDNTGIDIIATNTSLLGLPVPNPPFALTTLCPRPIVLAETAASPYTTFSPVHINIGAGTFHPIAFFLSPDDTKAYIVTTDRGVLVYDFNTGSTASGIPLINDATPVAADISVDGILIYVAGSDGLLHQLNTQLATDENQTSFSPLPNSPNSFCLTGNNCALDLVAVKP